MRLPPPKGAPQKVPTTFRCCPKEWYVPDEHTLHIDKLRGDVGTHESRHHVAAIKHCDDVAGWAREEWSTRFCNNAQFIEDIVVDDMLVEHIDRVLVDRKYWEGLEDAADEVMEGRIGSRC